MPIFQIELDNRTGRAVRWLDQRPLQASRTCGTLIVEGLGALHLSYRGRIYPGDHGLAPSVPAAHFFLAVTYRDMPGPDYLERPYASAFWFNTGFNSLGNYGPIVVVLEADGRFSLEQPLARLGDFWKISGRLLNVPDVPLDADTIAARIAPIVHLHPMEDYFPADPETHILNVQLFYRREPVLERPGLWAWDDVLRRVSSTQYHVHDDDHHLPAIIQGGSTYEGLVDLWNLRSFAPGFYHVVPGSKPCTAWITFYFFYAYQGGVGTTSPQHDGPLAGFEAHEADWEAVTADVEWSGNIVTVHKVGYEAHGDMTWITGPDNDHVPLDQLVPIPVYSAWRTHGSYAQPGKYPLKNVWLPFTYDYCAGGESSVTWNTGEFLVPLVDGLPAFINYPGRFGTIVEVPDGPAPVHRRVIGPIGPAFHDSWFGPKARAEEK